MGAETDHTFEGKENDWGFTQFVSLHEIMDPSLGFLENDALKLKVKIKVEHPDSYLYNSKRETGFVGLKNQGATCYMNSLLQTLYNINYFRQVSNRAGSWTGVCLVRLAVQELCHATGGVSYAYVRR